MALEAVLGSGRRRRMTDSDIRFLILMAAIVLIVLIGCVTSVLNNRIKYSECCEEPEGGEGDVPGTLPVRTDR